MNFRSHSAFENEHAFLSASHYHWINYDENKLAESWLNYQAKENGTILHEFAAQCIRLGQKLPRSEKTLNMYVNDAIGYKMTPEQILFYSENAFGTCDSIGFRDDILRIHDLKTGAIPAHIEQLYIYTALFCLEYKVKPVEIDMELRIYQNNEILIDKPLPEQINDICNKIVRFDQIINSLKDKEA